MPHARAVQVSPAASGRALTPAQKRFNSLIGQIQKSSASIAAWHDAIPAYRRANEETLQPLLDELLAAIRQWAFALDAAFDQSHWTQNQCETLRALVCEAIEELLDAGQDDAELKALFEKHADMDFAAQQQALLQEMKDDAQWMTGVDLGDDDIATDEELFERLRLGLDAEPPHPEEAASASAPPRRKSAADQRKEALAQQAALSVGDIYRQLAGELDPDREPDPAQRVAKTALMQRVNQAYESKNLLALLQLQLDIEQIDASHLADATDERLQHYNQVLAEQLRELMAEVVYLQEDFCLEFDLFTAKRLNPAKLGKLIHERRQELLSDLKDLRSDLQRLSDTSATERWLNEFHPGPLNARVIPPF